mmetsp:Transcript_39635/g.38174  ORF Transcript_39635/g.38174 Transcript_39635/m.38174 type:complete len:268 (+) Transcript_39635:930-1733(+)
MANEALEAVIKGLKVGSPIKDAYALGKQVIATKDPSFLNKIHTNFGFGIGSAFKEEILFINEGNDIVVEAGMAFHVRVTLSEIEKKPERSMVAIGETVVVEADTTRVLTSKIQRKYGEISYQLANSDEDKEEEEDESKNEESKESVGDEQQLIKDGLNNVILGTRLRQKNQGQHRNYEARQKSQDDLLDKKLEELKLKFENNQIQVSAKQEKVKKMENICSYPNSNTFPKDIKPGQLFVDKKNSTVLVPINNSFVPFHISTIKNVST